MVRGLVQRTLLLLVLDVHRDAQVEQEGDDIGAVPCRRDRAGDVVDVDDFARRFFRRGIDGVRTRPQPCSWCGNL
jgi:hypothetical protein